MAYVSPEMLKLIIMLLVKVIIHVMTIKLIHVIYSHHVDYVQLEILMLLTQ